MTSQYWQIQLRSVAFSPSSWAALNFEPKVFKDRQWATMGFLVASPTLTPEDLTKLGVRDHPHTSALVERICKNPPADEAIAAAWFALMAGLVTGAYLFTIDFV